MKRPTCTTVFLLTFFLLFQHNGFAQQAGKQVPIKVPATESQPNALLYLPWDYNISGKKYPLILFAHGSGESSMSSLPNQGLPGIISKNNPPYAIVHGDTIHFIVLSITGQVMLTDKEMSDGAKDLIKRGIRIDPERIYITGLSAGANEAAVGYISHQEAENFQRASATVPMSYTREIADLSNKYWVGKFSDYKGKGLWEFVGDKDHLHNRSHIPVAKAIVDSVQKYSPANAQLTIYPGSHCCWMTYYDPVYRETINGKKMNIYEWMMQYSLDGNNNALPANKPPVAKAGSDQTLTLPVSLITLDGSSSKDPDGKIVSYKWTKNSGSLVSLSFSNPNAAKTTVLGIGLAGTYVFTLTVKDNKGAIATNVISVTVKAAPNKAPKANAGNGQTITLPDNSVTLDGSASSDPDGNIASYKWTKKSGPASFKVANAKAVSSKVTGLVQGTYVFTLTVKDNDGATATNNVTVTVKAAPNQAPKANAGRNRTITLPDNSVTLNGSASSDPDGNIASYKWTKRSGPGSFSFENANAPSTKVSGLSAGTYVFSLKVTDNKKATTIDNITIYVKPVQRHVLVAKAGCDQNTITLPENSISLNGYASYDIGGKIVSYHWTKKSGPASFAFENAKAPSTRVSGLSAGTYIFSLKITDDKKTTAIDHITIHVNATTSRHILVAKAKSDHSTIVLPDNSVSLNGYASYDIGGKIVSYHWTKKSGPASFAFENAKAPYTKVSGLSAGTYVFSLKITDDKGATATNHITIHVNSRHVLVAKAKSDQSAITLPDNSVSLNGYASYDIGGKIVSYHWTKKSGPDSFAFENAKAPSTKVSGLSAGTYIFSLTVTDNKGSHSSDQVTVTVKRTAFLRTYQAHSDKDTGEAKTDSIGKTIAKEPKPKFNNNKDIAVKPDLDIYTTHRKDSLSLIFKVYPNPVHNRLHIELNKPNTSTVKFRLIDVNGRIIKAYKFGHQGKFFHQSIDVNAVPDGIYFIQLIEDDQLRKVEKIIKY